MAAWALGEIESSAAVASLTPLLRDPEDAVRAIAAWALGEIESASALPALQAARDDRSPEVQPRRQVGYRQHRRPPVSLI